MARFPASCDSATVGTVDPEKSCGIVSMLRLLLFAEGNSSTFLHSTKILTDKCNKCNARNIRNISAFMLSSQHVAAQDVNVISTAEPQFQYPFFPLLLKRLHLVVVLSAEDFLERFVAGRVFGGAAWNFL